MHFADKLRTAMHYGIVAIGSRGDVQPYVALALGLMDRGQEATVMAHENFKDFVEGYAVKFLPLEGNVEDMLKSEEGLKVLKSGRIIAFARYLQKTIRKTRESVSQDLYNGCQKADVLVASLLGMPWVDCIAEKSGKKWAIVQLNLPAIPTKAFPLAAMDFFNLPSYNLLTYRIFESFYWRSNKKGINDFRKSLGLPELKTPILKKISDEKIVNLHCFSAALLSRPNDWQAHNDISGFLFLPTNIEKIQGDLNRWLGSGDKPIYIGFGSIPIPDPELIKSIITELLRTTTHRFIFCLGWSLPINLTAHPRLFKVKSINHQWLFPRCKAAIIHGGVGTTAAALKAKIPLIIISIIADQPWWGKIIARKKLGVHIPFKKLSAQKLISAIEKTQGPQMQQNAVEMGVRINREDGLKQTIDALEKYFAG
jgi:sterol 3beta-glucosyltransferase